MIGMKGSYYDRDYGESRDVEAISQPYGKIKSKCSDTGRGAAYTIVWSETCVVCRIDGEIIQADIPVDDIDFS